MASSMNKESLNLEFRPSSSVEAFWKEYKRSGKTVRTVEIDIGSTGSVTLLFQAIIPYLLSAGRGSETVWGPGELEVTVKGGTNMDFTPSVEYFEQVLFPILNANVLPPGCSQFKINTQRRCWGSSAGNKLGVVTVSVPNLGWANSIPAFNMTSRGHPIEISVSLITPAAELEQTKALIMKALDEEDWGVSSLEIETVLVDEGPPKRHYLLLVAHTSNGFRLGRDVLYNRGDHQKSNMTELSAPGYMVRTCIQNLKAELAHGGCVDEYLQDQLVIFQVWRLGLA